mmetsp:Transcript_74745/g.241684  ORF Transcript_74745/g.241684 Transcript_74745/m.241684 type:complete len:245 (-) Transcript_74745:46-780(-)
MVAILPGDLGVGEGALEVAGATLGREVDGDLAGRLVCPVAGQGPELGPVVAAHEGQHVARGVALLVGDHARAREGAALVVVRVRVEAADKELRGGVVLSREGGRRLARPMVAVLPGDLALGEGARQAARAALRREVHRELALRLVRPLALDLPEAAAVVAADEGERAARGVALLVGDHAGACKAAGAVVVWIDVEAPKHLGRGLLPGCGQGHRPEERGGQGWHRHPAAAAGRAVGAPARCLGRE